MVVFQFSKKFLSGFPVSSRPQCQPMWITNKLFNMVIFLLILKEAWDWKEKTSFSGRQHASTVARAGYKMDSRLLHWFHQHSVFVSVFNSWILSIAWYLLTLHLLDRWVFISFHVYFLMGYQLSSGLGWVVRKPINANPGLKVDWSINFSCIQIFFTSYVLCTCSFRLLKLKTEGQTI